MNKYKKLKRQVSTDGGFTWTDIRPYEYKAGELIQRDSPDCNNVEWRTVSGYICEENTTEMTQWVADTGYVCVGFDKMNKEKEQVSYNSGISWTDTGNTRAGSTIIEQNSEDCGYNPDYSAEYLTTEALGDGYITLRKGGSGSNSKEPITNIQYSKNDGSWTSYTYDTQIPVVNGDKIRWKGTRKDGNSNDYYSSFGATAHYKAYGNPLSLLNNDSFVNYPNYIYNYAYYRLFYDNRQLEDISDLALPATTLANYCYYAMFLGCTSLTTTMALPATTLAENCYEYIFTNCTSLTTAPALPATTLVNHCYETMFSGCTSLTTAPALPATTLAYGCYNNMFNGCTSLTTAPALPATTLALDCYEDMFSGCTSLTTAPALPATTLAYGCYNNMFNGCTSLTTAPALPATTLANYCYHSMFRECISLITAPTLPATTLTTFCYAYMFDGCTSLNSVTCCATDISATDCTLAWLNNVAATGTFNKDANTTWPTGTSGIPSGWTTDTCGCEHDYSTEYLTTEALGNGKITLGEGYSGAAYENIQYSKNGGNWTSYTNGISVVTGDKIRWKAEYKNYVSGHTDDTYNKFSSNCNYKVYGNPISLLVSDNFQNVTNISSYPYAFLNLFLGESIYYTLTDVSNLALVATTLAEGCYKNMFLRCASITTAPALPATTLAAYSYYRMFAGCEGLTAAPALSATTLGNNCCQEMFNGCSSLVTAPSILPATTLADSCYDSMFGGCSSLTSAPVLPATTLADSCYAVMFDDCTNLTSAPVLPATTLADSCYSCMFYGCKSLTTAPSILPATTLADFCYDRMFYECSSLTSAPELPASVLTRYCYNAMFKGCRRLNNVTCIATNKGAYACTYEWLENVSTTGTFTKASGVTWSSGRSGIPSGWTVVDAT